MDKEKNEYIERMKKYNQGKKNAEINNRKNEEKIADEIIRNSNLDKARDKGDESEER